MFNLNQIINQNMKKLFVHTVSYAVGKLAFLLCLLSGPSFAFAQSPLTGTVTDDSGAPLVGANVLVEGTTLGTITDVEGKFTLLPPPESTITASFTGYKDVSIKLSPSQTAVKFVLTEDATQLDAVVAIGYGTVKKRDLTGSVLSMKNSDIVIAPTGNAMEALQGKISGLDITKTSGEVGSSVNILLRGSRSIYGNNQPLFIIDGFIGSYDQVNPSDIESIDVLKDASSTAIYGSAGANGVIIITTKRGKAGQATVNFDAYYGISGSPNYKHGMIGDEWTNYQREAYRYVHGSYPENMSALFGNDAYVDAYNQGKWIDWVDEAAGNTAVTQKYNFSVTGGNDKTKIFASASYANDKGLLANEDRDNYQLRLNLDQEIFPWATAGFSTNLNYTDHDRGVKNTFTKSISAFPLGEPRDSEGNLQSEFIDNLYSPLGDFIKNQFVNNTHATNVNANGYLEIRPLAGLSIKTQLSATLANSRLGQYWGKEANANLPTYAGSPWAQKTHNNSWNYVWENIFSYNRTIAEDHTIGAQFITSWQKAQNESTIAGGGGQMVDGWTFNQLLSTKDRHTYSDFSQTQQMSYAIRLNYSYKGKYLFTFSNRWDGVSWLAAGEKWDFFPAAAAAWRISDEGFMSGARNWIDNLKLRLSYGVTGNSGGMGAYATTTQAYFYTSNGVSVNGNAVPFAQYTGTFGGSIGWEKSYNWNVGLDFSLFNSRLDGSIEWFDTKTKGLLFQRTVPITDGNTGWGSPLKSWQNLAKTSNTGVEVTLNARTIRKPKFQWNTSLSLTWSKEKIDALPDGDLINENLFIGHPIKSVYGYKYAGIWGTDTPQDVLDAYGVEPGWVKVETIEQDGDGGKHKYSDKIDRMILGHQNPNWIVGLNNTFSFMNFDLTIYAMARTGQTITSDLIGSYTAKSKVTDNQISGIDYWTEDNQDAYFPRPGIGDKQSAGYNAFSVVDGSFIKIKNITLGYTLPKQLTRKIRIEKLRVYATCYNPFIYAMNKQLRDLDVDPETNGSDNFPTYRQFVFGVNFTF